MVTALLILLIQWQQRVDYVIDAYLDIEYHTLSATESIHYYNNSPFTLDTLYFHLYANAFKDGGTILAQDLCAMGYTTISDLKEGERGRIDIQKIRSGCDTLDAIINETIMSVPLVSPLQPADSCYLEIAYKLKIPKYILRLGYKDNHYEMSQWFPSLCVYDESGWHTDQYRGIGEFYSEFGSFDVTLDVPGNFVVAATGERTDSLDLVIIESLVTHGKRIQVDGRRKVTFVADNVHDFTWVADPDYLVHRHECDGIDIYVYCRERNEKKWSKAGSYAVESVQRFNKWFGNYPYKTLHVVDGNFKGGMEYPQLVIVGYGEDRFTRLFELTLAHEIGHQWFYGTIGTDEINEAWLDEGFASYAELRYLEDRYGQEHSLLRFPWFTLSRRYTHKVIYYIAQTNYLERPILSPAFDFVDIPFSYVNSAYTKPTLFLLYLESLIGQDKFDNVLRRFCSEYQFEHPSTADFMQICEEESGMQFDALFHAILSTTAFSDWCVMSVGNGSVEVKNQGDLILPVDLAVKTREGEFLFTLNDREREQTVRVPDTAGDITQVIIDPEGTAFESDYWNNRYPRKIKLQPFLSPPSLDATMIWFTPYLWYGTHDGIVLGFYMAGSDFIDYDYVKGKNLWLFGWTYGLKSKNLYPTFRYQTPVFYRKGFRVRIAVKAAQGNGEDVLHGGFTGDIGIPFTQSPSWHVSTMLVHRRLFNYQSVDSIDWDLGRTVTLENTILFEKKPWFLTTHISGAHTLIGSNWNFIKTSLEIKRDFYLLVPFSLRMFFGKIIGDAPEQELYYLSGKLRITFLPDLLGGGQTGYFSPQEHIHIPGDGNMRGYQTLHIKSDALYCLNLVIPSKTPIRLFADLGYCDQVVYDIGAQLVFGPLSLNVPFYIQSDESWKLRWSIGL